MNEHAGGLSSATTLREALTKLSGPHRAVIYRAYYLRRTTAQIAAELNTSECVVRCQLHYAMRELRNALEEIGAIR